MQFTGAFFRGSPPLQLMVCRVRLRRRWKLTLGSGASLRYALFGPGRPVISSHQGGRRRGSRRPREGAAGRLMLPFLSSLLVRARQRAVTPPAVREPSENVHPGAHTVLTRLAGAARLRAALPRCGGCASRHGVRARLALLLRPGAAWRGLTVRTLGLHSGRSISTRTASARRWRKSSMPPSRPRPPSRAPSWCGRCPRAVNPGVLLRVSGRGCAPRRAGPRSTVAARGGGGAMLVAPARRAAPPRPRAALGVV